jgi:hypothetical protein
MAEVDLCRRFAYWFVSQEGDFAVTCELPKGHDGDHWDGLSWFNEDTECTDEDHQVTSGDRR